MKEERVIELIEGAVGPLKTEIQALKKENEQLKIQLFAITHPGKSYHQRQRSSIAQITQPRNNMLSHLNPERHLLPKGNLGIKKNNNSRRKRNGRYGVMDE